MSKLNELYQGMKRYVDQILVVAVLGGVAAMSLDTILHTRTGSFVDPQTERKYNYSLVDRWNSRHVFIRSENNKMPFCATKIRDLDRDGSVDHVGSFTYPRMPIEFNRLDFDPDLKEHAQRMYDLAFADSQK